MGPSPSSAWCLACHGGAKQRGRPACRSHRRRCRSSLDDGRLWLDARSERDREQTLAERYAELVHRDPEGCTAEIDAKLRGSGHGGGGRRGSHGCHCGATGLAGRPRGGAPLRWDRGCSAEPAAHAIWMFVAGFVRQRRAGPSIRVPDDRPRAMGVGRDHHGALVALGIGRSMVSERGALQAVVETVGVASAAAAAGLVIGQLMTACSESQLTSRLERSGQLVA